MPRPVKLVLAAPLVQAAAPLLANLHIPPPALVHVPAPAPSWIPAPAPSWIPAPAPSWIPAPSPMALGASRWLPVYRWIPVVGAFIAFAWSLAIGANDVASSFGTSVGSGALSMLAAVLLAGIMEFVGAASMGEPTIDTFQTNVLKEIPADRTLLMWGLFIAILVATIWLALATRWALPVSSTLTIVGAIIGVSLAGEGFPSIYWEKASSQLHLGGVLGIFMSWIIAPLIAGLASFFLFTFTKLALLRSSEAEKWTLRAMPLYYGITVSTLLLFIIYRGAARAKSMQSMGVGKAFLIAGVSGIVAGVFAFVILFLSASKLLHFSNKVGPSPSAETRMNTAEDSQGKELTENVAKEDSSEKSADDLIKQYTERHVLETVYEADSEEETDPNPDGSVHCGPACAPRITFQTLISPSSQSSFKRMRSRNQLTLGQKVVQRFKRFYSSTINHKLEYGWETEARHRLAEKFDSRAEGLFSFLQILTACVAAFSHGSNEVAQDLNPYAAVLQLYNYHNDLNLHVDVPVSAQQWMKYATFLLHVGTWQEWVFVLGGVGVFLGFALWGWKIVSCIGGGITYMSPARGYCAQFSAVAAALLATRTNLPVSTTHIVIAAILGVGLADNVKTVNWKLLLIFVAAWVATLLVSSTTAAGLYSFTIYSPSYSTG